jgi:hypothetical protein
MNPRLSAIVEGKKYMWDGVVYPTEEAAVAARAAYQRDDFETQMLAGDGEFYVYTRRVVKAVAVTQ